MEQFFTGFITSWIAGLIGIVLGVVGSALLIRFKDRMPALVERAIDFIFWVE